MTKKTGLLVFGIGLILLAVGLYMTLCCQGPDPESPMGSSEQEIPADSGDQSDITRGRDKELIAIGALLYLSGDCSSCHAAAEGTADSSPAFTDLAERYDRTGLIYYLGRAHPRTDTLTLLDADGQAALAAYLLGADKASEAPFDTEAMEQLSDGLDALYEGAEAKN